MHANPPTGCRPRAGSRCGDGSPVRYRPRSLRMRCRRRTASQVMTSRWLRVGVPSQPLRSAARIQWSCHSNSSSRLRAEGTPQSTSSTASMMPSRASLTGTGTGHVPGALVKRVHSTEEASSGPWHPADHGDGTDGGVEDCVFHRRLPDDRQGDERLGHARCGGIRAHVATIMRAVRSDATRPQKSGSRFRIGRVGEAARGRLRRASHRDATSGSWPCRSPSRNAPKLAWASRGLSSQPYASTTGHSPLEPRTVQVQHRLKAIAPAGEDEVARAGGRAVDVPSGSARSRRATRSSRTGRR
jgi:hypothetical protein